MRFQFIAGQRETFPVRDLCKALNVSPNGYYAWRTRPVSAREMANQQLIEKIRAASGRRLPAVSIFIRSTSNPRRDSRLPTSSSSCRSFDWCRPGEY